MIKSVLLSAIILFVAIVSGFAADSTAVDYQLKDLGIGSLATLKLSDNGDGSKSPYVHLDSALDLSGATVTLNLTDVTALPGATPTPSPASALMVQTYSTAPLAVTIPVLPTATRVSSTAYEASHVLKNAAAILISVSGYNSGPAQFIQLFNSTTVPADTAVPVAVFTVATTSNFSYTVPVTGVPFTTGIAVSNSSTGPTKTVGGSDCYFTAVVK